MAKRKFISADEFLLDSYRLAAQVLDSGFRPNFLVGLWRGGTPVGIAVQEFLNYRGIETDHIAIRTSAYSGVDKIHPRVRVHGLDYIVKRINAEDRLLLVDDVFDKGLTMQAVLSELQRKARKNTPEEIRTAVVYYKPARNLTEQKPDYYIHQTKSWLYFPHELEGLTKEEIRKYKRKEIAELLK